MRLFVTCFVVAFAAVLAGLMAMFLGMAVGLVSAFAVGASAAGAVAYFVLRGRVLARGRALVVALAAAALVAAPFAFLAGFSVRAHRENVRAAERLCRTAREYRARFTTFDACVDVQADALDRQD